MLYLIRLPMAFYITNILALLNNYKNFEVVEDLYLTDPIFRNFVR